MVVTIRQAGKGGIFKAKAPANPSTTLRVGPELVEWAKILAGNFGGDSRICFFIFVAFNVLEG